MELRHGTGVDVPHGLVPYGLDVRYGWETVHGVWLLPFRKERFRRTLYDKPSTRDHTRRRVEDSAG